MKWAAAVLTLALACPWGWAQEPTPKAKGSFERTPVIGDFVRHQKAIVTAPLRLRLKDVVWLAPLTGITAGLITQDASVSRHLDGSADRIRRSTDVSNYGLAALAGAGGGLYLLGVWRRDEQQRQAGWLAAEAMAHTALDVEVVKLAFGRERPGEGNGQGRFGAGGQSFPSMHAALAWSAATVLAHEYPGPVTQALAYGGAAAISAARIASKKHFPSDVLMGSALGYFVGRQIWKDHQSDDDGRYGKFVREAEGERQAADMGSPYIPIDSWVYAAFDRLHGLGFLPTAFLGLRPWTRMECARLLGESQDLLSGDETEYPEAARLQAALARELRSERRLLSGGRNFSADVDEVYVRWTGIGGTPLRDGYHFAQTLVNDYGRPYGEGGNAVLGFSSRASAGPLAFYVRGEYQHAPALPAYGQRVLEAIAGAEFGQPVPLASPSGGADDFRLLDSYVALSTHNLQFSFGKQTLWWGPGRGGAMLFSNNAEPIYMLRASRTSPLELPSILRWLGPVRTEFFVGRLAGQRRVNTERGPVITTASLDPQPYIHGEKIGFRPTENLEFSLSRTTVFGGPAFPFTTRRFVDSMFSTGNAFGADDPGDRRSGFEFSYRLPKLRRWVQWYADGFTEDQPSPIAYADRSSWRTGVYLPRIPGLAKLDFRAEGTYTDWPIGVAFPGFNFFNVRYLDGYTNKSQLLGDWIGRQGHGVQAWSTYWLSGESTVQVGYRKQKVSPDFLQGGGLDDISARGVFRIRPDMTVSTGVQYERWRFPLLGPAGESNFAGSVQVTWRPGWKRK